MRGALGQVAASALRVVKAARNVSIPASSQPWHGDAMTRFPALTPQGVLRGLDYFGTAVFAASGAVTAGESGIDSFGCTLVGCITAMGGGTVRDLVLGKQAFWVKEFEYPLIAASSAALAFFFWPEFGASFFMGLPC